MAVTNFDGMLLAGGSLKLPDNVNLAYIAHPDNPSGIPLVAKCFKYRVVDLPAKGGHPLRKATPNGPSMSTRNGFLSLCLPAGTSTT